MRPITQFHATERAFIERVTPPALAHLEQRREIHRLAEALLADWANPQAWLALGEVLRESGFRSEADWLDLGEDETGQVLHRLYVFAMRQKREHLAEQLQAAENDPVIAELIQCCQLLASLDSVLWQWKTARRAMERGRIEEALRSSGLPMERWRDAVRLAEKGNWLPEELPFDALGNYLADSLEGDEVGQEVPVSIASAGVAIGLEMPQRAEINGIAGLIEADLGDLLGEEVPGFEVPRDRKEWIVLADELGLVGEFARGEVSCQELLALRSSRMQKDGQEVLPEVPEVPEGGPVAPDRFRLGEVTVEKLTADQHWLLNTLWHQPERTISLRELSEKYSERKPRTGDPAEALRKLIGRVNYLLCEANARHEVERVNDHYRIISMRLE